MINAVREQVKTLLANENHAHGIDHAERILNMSIRFGKDLGVKDMTDLKLIALLHDIDDYKIFKNPENLDLPNARRILNDLDISSHLYDISGIHKDKILNALREIGFSKRLQGVVPSTIEAMIVSDADMCDGMGATGIIRTTQYGDFKGRPFFAENNMPRRDISYEQYRNYPSETSVNHIFEKLLTLKDRMLTAPGYKEASARHDATVQFLRAFFMENNLEEWDRMLTKQLNNEPFY